MKNWISELLYKIHHIRPQKGLYHSKIQPFVVSFDSCKKVVDFLMDVYHAWYDFDALLAWRNGYVMRSRNVWNSYFDPGLGKVVDSPKMIDDQVKKGKFYWTPREMKEYVTKQRKYQEQESRKRDRKYLMEQMRKIKQGYKPSEELRRKRLEWERDRRRETPIYE